LPFLYAVKFARDQLDVPEETCVHAVALYFIFSFIYMASGWISGWRARPGILYRDFLRRAKKNKAAFDVLPFAYLIAIPGFAGGLYIMDFQLVVDDFLSNGKLGQILKMFAIVPGAMMLIFFL
jgi:hypothetical protein